MQYSGGIVGHIDLVTKIMIDEEETPEDFFSRPKTDRAKKFLQEILTH